MTSAVVVLLLVTVVFSNNFLNARMAENEFSAMKQFMQTTGLQLDDVAWTIGRTQTIRYASKFGLVNFESLALNYSIYVDKGANFVFLANYSTGIVLFNMPISRYSVSNGYHEAISPASDRSFLQFGTSAPVCHVYVIEKVPMNNGNYIRVVAAPSIRMLNTTISTGAEVKNYFKMYLPILNLGPTSRYSQSLTLVGSNVLADTEGEIKRIRIRVVTPKASLGFDQDFFHFDNSETVVNVPAGSILQFYTGEVTVSLGPHT